MRSKKTGLRELWSKKNKINRDQVSEVGAKKVEVKRVRMKMSNRLKQVGRQPANEDINEGRNVVNSQVKQPRSLILSPFDA